MKQTGRPFESWFRQVRGPFLILAVVLVFIGVAAAGSRTEIRFWPVFLLFTGTILAHMAVNLFNELSDYHTGIDLNTSPTPFSGGSGMMQSGKTDPKTVKAVAYTCWILAGVIGLYFCLTSNPLILIFMLTGGLAIRFYTTHLTRWMMGEVVAGLTLGTGVVLGVYLALIGSIDREIIMVSIPPGILTTQLLFLNEFPDMEADRAGGRRHWVIHWGKEKSPVLYSILNGFVFIFIIVMPWLADIPRTIWIALSVLPLGIINSIRVLRDSQSSDKWVSLLGMNVMMILITDALLGVGIMIGQAV